ncbi:MAG TPA: hypothetical protein DEB39_11635 [Planctomycetaceae bacterium]|nr:hypothetical protein [Planctomycetaceae bacterium]
MTALICNINFNAAGLLLSFGIKTLILGVAASVVSATLLLTDCRSATVRRYLWIVVLLLGVFGAGFPITFAVPHRETTAPETAMSVTSASETSAFATSAPVTSAPVTSAPDFPFPVDVPARPVLPPAQPWKPDSVDSPTPSRFDVAPRFATEPETLSRQRLATDVPSLLVSVWLVGIAGILAWRLGFYGLLLRKLATAPFAEGEYRSQWETILAEYGLAAERLPLLLVDSLGPGLIRTPRGERVVVPRELWEESPKEMREGILRHELAHYRNRDCLVAGFARLLALPHWFNPVSWFVLRRIDEASEWICDAAAFGMKPDGTRRFAESLLAVHESSRTVSLHRYAFGGKGKGMERRVRELQCFIDNRKDSIMKKTTLCLVLGLFLVAGLFHVRFVPAVTGDDTKTPQVKDAAEPENGNDTTKQPGEEAAPGTAAGMAVRLTDAEGKPAATGYVRTYPRPRPADWEGDQPRNFPLENGTCFVPLSNFDQLQSFKIVLYADGFAPYEIDWNNPASDPIPRHFVFQLKDRAADPIGGRIVDEEGKPVEGAIVQFGVDMAGRQKNPDMFPSYAQWIHTDAEGRWIYKVLPKEQLDENFDMNIEHARYPRLRFPDGQTFKDYQVKDAEGNLSKTIVLPKGLPLRGRIVDEEGKPVENVLVHCNAAWRDPDKPYGHESTRSDADGRFAFENCSPKGELRTVDIGFCSKNFAPDIVSLEEITPDMKPLEIKLKRGKRLVIRAVDTEGKPLAGMRISSGYWKSHWGAATGVQQLFEDADEFGAVRTDKDGLFVWSNAPDNRFDLKIDGDNYQNVKIDYETLKYGDEENVYTFRPLVDVAGTVTDAATGNPIPAFAISEWYTFRKSTGTTREFGTQAGKDGRFTRRTGHRMGECDHYYLRVDAEGYEGVMREIKPDDADLKLEFPLKKATAFSQNLVGTVLLPDGKPAAGVEIGIATAAYGIQTKGAKLNAGGMGNNARTDAEGRFSISRSEMSIGDQDYQLLFLHDAGTVRMKKEQFERHTGPIRLEAWGRIEGTVRVGNKPGANLPIWYSVENDRDPFEEGKARIDIFSDDELKSDADGKYVIDRVFPGKGTVARVVRFNNGTTRAPMLGHSFEIKPGETLRIDLGGGGQSVRGKILLAPDTPKPVDWRFAHVEAEPSNPDYVALPAQSEEDKAFYMDIIRSIPEFNSPGPVSGLEVEEIITRWEASPEGKAMIAKNPAAYERCMNYMDFAAEFEKKREERGDRRIIGAVDETGTFQLDDLTPGLWTLEIELNFPSVPLQWWDYADRWMKKIDFAVPDVPGNNTDAPLELQGIPLGYDKGERKGPGR